MRGLFLQQFLYERRRLRGARIGLRLPAAQARLRSSGAQNWACIASLIETCKLNGVDPQAYFADVLSKLVNLWPASRLDELMPWAWAAAHSNNKLAA
jgi:IS66 C-terminal element